MKDKVRRKAIIQYLTGVIICILLFLIVIQFIDLPTSAIPGDLVPQPDWIKGLDCDDCAIYTYLYFRYLGYTDNLTIMRSKLPSWIDLKTGKRCYHVWVEIGNNNETIVYDFGYAFEKTPGYDGRPISYGQLLDIAGKDY